MKLLFSLHLTSLLFENYFRWSWIPPKQNLWVQLGQFFTGQTSFPSPNPKQ